MASTDDAVVQGLLAYSTCDVADALLRLHVPNGGFLAGIRMFSPEHQAGTTKIAGPAYTVQYGPRSDIARKRAKPYIDGTPPGAVVVLSSPPTTNALFGGLMATRAQVRGAAGTVVDGRLRDLGEQRALGYAVFARGVGTTAPHETVQVVDVGTPLQIVDHEGPGGTSVGAPVTVHEGDYVMADLNGVVVVPRAQATAALGWMERLVAADMQLEAALRAGMSFGEASKKYRG